MNLIKVILEKTDQGFSTYTNDVLGCTSAGANLEEAKVNMTEALKFHKECLEELDQEIPDKLKGKYQLKFTVDIKSYLVNITQYVKVIGLAKLSGINKDLLSLYVNGKKTPGPKQIQKIENAIEKLKNNIL